MPLFEISEIDMADANGLTGIAIGPSGHEGIFVLRLSYVSIGFNTPEASTVFLLKFHHLVDFLSGILQTVALTDRAEDFIEEMEKTRKDMGESIEVIIDLPGE